MIILFLLGVFKVCSNLLSLISLHLHCSDVIITLHGYWCKDWTITLSDGPQVSTNRDILLFSPADWSVCILLWVLTSVLKLLIGALKLIVPEMCGDFPHIAQLLKLNIHLGIKLSLSITNRFHQLCLYIVGLWTVVQWSFRPPFPDVNSDCVKFTKTKLQVIAFYSTHGNLYTTRAVLALTKRAIHTRQQRVLIG